MAQSPATHPKPEPSSPCPCGSGLAFGECCEPILSGAKVAPTAETVMRARYTSHVIGDQRFLHNSYLPTSTTPFVAEPDQPLVAWCKLVVHSSEVGPAPDTAYVDFSAYHDDGKNQGALHEKAEFVRQNGTWIYTRPVREGPAPVRLAQPKPGRNDPCPCGSGKKYKHCCGR